MSYQNPPLGGYAPPPQQQAGGYAPPPQQQVGGYPLSPQQQSGGYAPPPQQQAGGYAPPPQQQGGGYAPPPQQQAGGYAPPPQQQSGGYAPPPQQQVGGYPLPPQQQSGGYAPPPQQQAGGYAPPPQQQAGGYAPPPQQQGGGHAPPPQQQAGGYASPPQQQAGGYAPPPQQQGGGNQPPPQQQAGSYAPPPQVQASNAEDDGRDTPSDVEEVADDSFIPTDTNGLQSYEGYGEVGFKNGGFVPPPPPPKYEEAEPPSMEFGRAADISELEARTALLEYVAENCCFGKGAAEKMEMKNLKPSNAFHYTLETFCEGRTTARTEVPYRGDIVDGPFNGPPPLPWNIPHAPGTQFADQVYKLPVPHTAEVRTCGRCRGCGDVTCGRCGGRGRVRCSSCSGRGYNYRTVDGHSERDSCHWCHGSGRRTCNNCRGGGRVVCPHCEGACRVKNFIQLTVTYMNHVTDYILEETDMPDHLVRDVEGVQIFSQELPQVFPITSFPVNQINENSGRLIMAARNSFPTERQLNQRQTLRAVPVTEIDYTYKDISTRFWVFGMQRKVYAPDYPEQCCWGCTIL